VQFLKTLVSKVAPDGALAQAKKLHYVRAVRRFGVAERSILRALVSSGGCVVDLGANVGWYTKVLSELVGPMGRVYSVEPIPPTFELLTHCVRRLRLDNVALFNCAVSDRSGLASMEVPRYVSGGENFYQARLVDGQVVSSRLRTFCVPVRTVDSLLVGAPGRVEFIKVDVEGHESSVLHGTRDVIRRFLPAMYVEVTSDCDDASSSAAQLLDYLGGEGYRPFLFDGGDLVRRRRGDRSVNYFFLASTHLGVLERAGIGIR
jgi:FkbM family methyltransferase